ncbi:MAG: alpha-L-arabinofuranosidase C-terminal domain-containing protein [Anaerolineae bacterium]
MSDTLRITRQALYDAPISPLIYGDFMEPLNDLLPGMWADRLEDRAFAGCRQPLHLWREHEDWTLPRWLPLACGAPSGIPQADCPADLEMVKPEVAVARDSNNPWVGEQSARVEVRGAETRPYLAGIAQYHIAVKQGETLRLTLHLRGKGLFGTPIQAWMGRPYGVFFQIYAQAQTSDIGEGWTKWEAELTPTVTDDQATLLIGVSHPATFWVGKASLMPVENCGGWRPDIVQAVRALKPGIIRFGGSSLIYYQWEQGIGPRERRAPFENLPWGNTEENDVGLHEFLLFCELVEARPLICLNSNSTTVDQVLAEIEYCNGSATTRYGAIRAAMGHPQPFGVRYWQIGNEQSGEDYERTLVAYARAIRSHYPDLVLMASYPSDSLVAQLSEAFDYICPHLYTPHSPAMEAEMRALIAKIQAESPNPNLKLGITEWNHTGGHWGDARAWLLTLYNALNAGRMLNMYQRLGDMICIANRSNMTNSSCSGILQTQPDGLYVTPTYYVQQAYATYAGDCALRVEQPEGDPLDISATLRAADGTVVLAVVNGDATPAERILHIEGEKLAHRTVQVWTLTGPCPEAVNSPVDKAHVAPTEASFPCTGESLRYTFPAYSVTILRI